MATKLEEIADRSKKTRDEIASEMGCARMTLYYMLRKPRKMSLEDLEKFADAVDRSPRNLFSLIINN